RPPGGAVLVTMNVREPPAPAVRRRLKCGVSNDRTGCTGARSPPAVGDRRTFLEGDRDAKRWSERTYGHDSAIVAFQLRQVRPKSAPSSRVREIPGSRPFHRPVTGQADAA